MSRFNLLIACCLLLVETSPLLIAQETQAKPTPKTPTPDSVDANEKTDVDEETGFRRRRTPPPLVELPTQLKKLVADSTPLNPEHTVFLSESRKSVLLRTQVACNECLLEMLCYNESAEKGHESLLWIRAEPKVIHMALLATGATPGEPALFSPSFKAPWGPKVDIYLNWMDKQGKQQRTKAQTWMRRNVSRYYSTPLATQPAEIEFPYLELRYDPYNKEIVWYGQMTKDQREELLKKCSDEEYQAAINQFYKVSQPTPMDAEFVFAGSYHYTIEETGERIYAADGGRVICVANFAGALIDVKEASSADDGGRSYEAWPGRVPPRDTPVIVELIPAINAPTATIKPDGSKAKTSTADAP